MPTHQIIQTKVGEKFSSALSVPTKDVAITSRSSRTDRTRATPDLIRDVRAVPGRASKLNRGYWYSAPPPLRNIPMITNDRATVAAAPTMK